MEGRVEEFLIDRASRAREGRRLIASKELPRTRKGRHKATEGGLSGGNSTHRQEGKPLEESLL